MHFSSRRITIPASVQWPMALCDTCKFLGFTLDSNLNWKNHVEALCVKLSSAVFALRKLKPLISSGALRQMYFAYFHSLMSYGSVLWGDSTDANRVLLMQKRALRTMAGVKPRQSCRPLFVEYRIMTHYSQYLFEILMFTRENLSSFGRVEVPGISLRRTGRLKTVPRRTALLEKNPRVIGPTFYEELPADLKNESSDETFRRRLKSLLLENPLYSVKEYNSINYNIV